MTFDDLNRCGFRNKLCEWWQVPIASPSPELVKQRVCWIISPRVLKVLVTPLINLSLIMLKNVLNIF